MLNLFMIVFVHLFLAHCHLQEYDNLLSVNYCYTDMHFQSHIHELYALCMPLSTFFNTELVFFK